MNFVNKNIISAFDYGVSFNDEKCVVNLLTAGHINNTFAVRPEGNQGEQFIIQKINTNVFKDPVGLMFNIKEVTEHIIKKMGGTGNGRISTLVVVPTVSGKTYCVDEEGGYWRCYKFIEDAVSMDNLTPSTETFYAAARILGEFQETLADFDASKLFEVIPKFHDTVNRFANFKKSVAENRSGRLSTCMDEVNFVLERESFCSLITDGIANGSIPLRVTHNDTKLSNIMADSETGEPICMIDFDTIMPGSALYDFGDCLRTAASSGAEDEKDLSKVNFLPDVFDAFTKGYLSVAGKFLSDEEIALLPESVKMMTFECGTRFLADYIDGDTYFSTHYAEHNLVRARTQFKLVADMEKQMDQLHAIVAKYAANK